MKSIFLVLFSFTLIFAAKEKPVIKPNPEYFGAYHKTGGPATVEWTLKPMAKPERIAFYHNKDTDFVFYVQMKDSTHFSTKGQFTQQIDGQPTRIWSAKGEFLPGGQMKIAVHIADAGLKLSFDLEAAEQVPYTKK